MNDLHEASPEFLRHLEWQTRTELRRRERFAAPAKRTSGLLRLFRSAALVLASLTVGASAVLAVERLQDSRELEVRLERNRVRVELAERRVASAEEQLEAQRLRHEQGQVPQEGPRDAEQRLVGFVLERDHLRLEREELNAARSAPDLRLSAPLVGPRDFVSEHLRLDQAHATRVADLLGEAAAVSDLHAQEGLVSSTSHARVRREAESAANVVQRLDERLALRADFVLGRLDAATCERQDLVTGAEHRRRELDAMLVHLRRELERAEQLEAAGFAAGESGPLGLELEALEVELQLIDLELELLR